MIIEAVDHHVDVVALVLVEADLFGESLTSPSTRTRKNRREKRFQLLLDTPPCAPGRSAPGSSPRAFGGYAMIVVDDHASIVCGVISFPQLVQCGPPDPGEQQPEMVVDLRDRPHGGAGFLSADFCSIAIAGESPSIDSTSGLSICSRNWPGVGGERLHVAPLPLGVDRVEGERRFPGTRKPR